jgi:heat shock protein HspQ
MKYKILLPSMLALAILITGILATRVSAEEVSNYPPIVQRIADEFNLNVSEVEEVFDDERDERRAEMYALFAERLNDAVSEGKLTEDQRDVILEHHEDMQNQMESLTGLTHDERKQKIREIHEEFRLWVESEGIDVSSFGQMDKEGFRKGMHGGYMIGGW